MLDKKMLVRLLVAVMLVGGVVTLAGCLPATVGKCLLLDNTNKPCN